MVCSMHGCNEQAITKFYIVVNRKPMTIWTCSRHEALVQALVADVQEEKELLCQQRQERALWGDPQRAVI